MELSRQARAGWSRTDPRGRGSRVFFRGVKRARAALHRSLNGTEASSPESERSRYFHHGPPPSAATSTSSFSPSSFPTAPARGVLVSALSLQSSSPSLEVTPPPRPRVNWLQPPSNASRSSRFSFIIISSGVPSLSHPPRPLIRVAILFLDPP